MLFVGVLSLAFFEYQEAQKEQRESADILVPWDVPEFHSIEVEAQQKFKLQKNGEWNIVEPFRARANQDAVERNLQIVAKLKADSTFPMEEDRFGFDQSRGKIAFQKRNGEILTFIWGGKDAPRNNIYLLSPERNQVYVVHNVWGQFFHGDLNTLKAKVEN